MSNFICAPKTKPSELDLFPACNAIMDDEIAPQDYTDLTRRGLARLGVNAENGLLQDRAEKIRAAMDAGRNGCTLVRLPDPTRQHGYRVWAVKRAWFQEPGANWLFPDARIPIPAKAQPALRGAQDAIMRLPYMRTNIPGMERSPRRAYAAVLGFVIEHHVSDWMRLRWPALWQPPPNDGKWAERCAWDFSMDIPGVGVKTFDVAGARERDGKYSGEKPLKANYHLLSRREKDHFLFEGVVKGADFYGKDIRSTQWQSPLYLIAWINCRILGLPYRRMGQLVWS